MKRSMVHLALMVVLVTFGAAAAGAATNAETEAAITAALQEKLAADAAPIRVAFYDGKATLSGKVEKRWVQEMAEQVSLWVPGVRRVDNQIEAADARELAGGKMAAEAVDANLEASVKRALRNDVGADHAGDVEVEACDGVVSLRGTVTDQTRIGQAVAAAQKVSGVERVIDLLRPAG
jgi:osmotically-inducible protein OsmY